RFALTARLAAVVVFKARPGGLTARAFGSNAVAEPFSLSATAMIGVTVTAGRSAGPSVAGGLPSLVPLGPHAAIGMVAAGNVVVPASTKTLASLAVSSACAAVNSSNPWGTTQTKCRQSGYSAAPAFRSTRIAISVE